MRLHVIVAIGIENAELHRIHADEVRELVHLALDRKIHRGDAEATHRGRRRAIGEHAIDVAIDIGDRVRAGQMRGAFDGSVAGEPRIGAAVEIGADLSRNDAAVAHHAILDVDALGAAGRAVPHLFLAPKHIAHGTPGQHRAENGERLGDRIHLAAKSAADRSADEVKGVRRHVKNLGAGVDREEEGLRRCVDDIAPVGVGCCDRAVGLGRRMLDRRHLVALFQHVIGLTETALDVAKAQFLMIVFVVVGEGVFGIGLVDDRRAWLQGFLDIEHRGQRFVIDAYPRHCFISFARAVCDHGNDRLAFVTHLVNGKRGLVVNAEVDEAEQGVEIARHIGAADDPADARRAFRVRRIDAAQPRMRMRAADDLQMQHALQLVIVEIGRGARDVSEHVLPLRSLADFLQVVVALVGEDVLAQFQHGFRPLRAGPSARSSGKHGVDDRLIAGAPADIPGDGLDNLGAGRRGIAIEQSLRGHQHARRAVAALGREVVRESALQGVQIRSVLQSVQRLDRASRHGLGKR